MATPLAMSWTPRRVPRSCCTRRCRARTSSKGSRASSRSDRRNSRRSLRPTLKFSPVIPERMVMANLDYKAIDVDNHYYEPLDAFTRHLDKKFKRRGVQMVSDGKRTWAGIGDRGNH